MKNLNRKNSILLPLMGIFIIALLASFTFEFGQGDGTSWCSFLQNNYITSTNNPTDMQFDYDKAWKEIEALEKQGLPKSALEKVNVLLENARSEGEHAQYQRQQQSGE